MRGYGTSQNRGTGPDAPSELAGPYRQRGATPTGLLLPSGWPAFSSSEDQTGGDAAVKSKGFGGMTLKYLFGVALWAPAALFVAAYFGWVPLSAETLAVAGIALILLTTAAAWFIEMLDRRLSAMTQAAEKMAAGMEQVRLEVPKGSEFSALEHSFNRMAEQMQRRVADLQLNLQQQRAIAEHGPDAMWVFHVEGFCLSDTNHKFAELTGYRREALIGMTPMDVSPPTQAGGVPTADYARQIIARAIAGEKVVAPWTIRTRDGEEIPCELRAVHLPAPDRTLICGSLSDNRERMKAQAEIAHRVRFESLITRLSTGMISLKTEDIDTGVQHALAEIGLFAGVDRSYVFQFHDEGRSFSYTHEWCAPGIEPAIQRLQRTSSDTFPWVIPQLLRGETVHVPRVVEAPAAAAAEVSEWQAESIRSLILVPMIFGGSPAGFVGFDSVREENSWPPDFIALLRIFGEMVANVLHRKETETLMQQKNETLARLNTELERHNLELQQFAYVASHDLQEPLRTISSFSELLQRRYREQLDDKGQSFLDYVSDAAKRMHALINALLDYSRIDNRSRPFEPCDMQHVLEMALSNLSASIQDTGATVRHDPLPEVTGDPSQLMLVFQNLVGNAIKFHGPQAPEIHVSAKPASEDGRMVEFSVRDNGIGIDADDHDQIFQIFKRLHGNDKYPGTGIGLATCKRVVERHRGRIWVEPNPEGSGTVFRFTLPAVGDNQAPA
jgi:PAS domain S-box-containing protein